MDQMLTIQRDPAAYDLGFKDGEVCAQFGSEGRYARRLVDASAFAAAQATVATRQQLLADATRSRRMLIGAAIWASLATIAAVVGWVR